MFDSMSVSVDGDKIELFDNKVIVDIGIIFVFILDEVCDVLYKKIDGVVYSEKYQGYFIFKFIKVDSFLEFSVVVGGREFVIQKEDFIFVEVDESNYYGGVQLCGFMLFDIFGDMFLKFIYVIWDQGNLCFGVVFKIEKEQKVFELFKDGDGVQKVICMFDKSFVKKLVCIVNFVFVCFFDCQLSCYYFGCWIDLL